MGDMKKLIKIKSLGYFFLMRLNFILIKLYFHVLNIVINFKLKLRFYKKNDIF